MPQCDFLLSFWRNLGLQRYVIFILLVLWVGFKRWFWKSLLTVWVWLWSKLFPIPKMPLFRRDKFLTQFSLRMNIWIVKWGREFQTFFVSLIWKMPTIMWIGNTSFICLIDVGLGRGDVCGKWCWKMASLLDFAIALMAWGKGSLCPISLRHFQRLIAHHTYEYMCFVWRVIPCYAYQCMYLALRVIPRYA